MMQTSMKDGYIIIFIQSVEKDHNCLHVGQIGGCL